eukprot:c16280_g1_i1.p1 GENE.c16280_g1_i1~~c16280_g1_i1.p1  ORF type:complete len:765 (+),score=141.41 c16280_g1_i1:489-2783(+)
MWAWLSLLVGVLAFPHHEAPSVSFLELEAPVRITVEQLTLTAEVGEGHFLNAKKIRAFQAAQADPKEVEACASPDDDEYVVTACTPTANTVFAKCTRIVKSDQFVSQPCVHGDWQTLGSDTVIKSCSHPEDGTSRTAQPCVSGDFKTVGRDTVIEDCLKAIPDGQYVTATCVAGSATVAGTDTHTQGCTPPASGVNYVKAACVSGSNVLLGSNTVFGNCDQPSGTTFAATVCEPGTVSTSGSNTHLTPCAEPTEGVNYVKAACVLGSTSTTGTDTVLESCLKPTNAQFTTKLCMPGSSLIVGSGSAVSDCKQPTPGANFVQTACIAGSTTVVGSDAVLDLCLPPADGQFTIAVCRPGSAFQAGTNSISQRCRVPAAGTFVSTTCQAGSTTTLGTDTALSTCRAPVLGSTFASNACVPGSYNQLGSDATLSICSSCSSAQSLGSACSLTSDTQCLNVQFSTGSEYNNLTITCPAGRVLRILSSMWGKYIGLGRTPQDVQNYCGYSMLTTTQQNCEGLPSCNMSPKRFFKSCSDSVTSYLDVKYLCVPITVDMTIKVDTVCDISGNLNIYCGLGRQIRIDSVFFGRSSASVCGPVTITNPSDLQCQNTNALTVLQNRCNGNSECSYPIAWLKDPDPCPRVTKYLDYTYTCLTGVGVPRYVNSATCAPGGQAYTGSNIQLDCGYGKKISVTSVLYGRVKNSNMCDSQGQFKNVECSSPDALASVKATCDGKQSCVTTAADYVLAPNTRNFCGSAPKYTQVTFICLFA